MKRCLVSCISLALALSLVACSGESDISNPSNSVTNGLHNEETTSSLTNQNSDEVVFQVTVDEVIKILSDNMPSEVSVLPSNIEPTTIEQEKTENSPAAKVYSYSCYDGVDIQISESIISQKVSSIFVIANIEKLSNEALYDLGCYEANLVGMFEPDRTKWDTIDNELNIENSNFSENNIYMSTGTMAEYLYIIDDGVSMLSITPIATTQLATTQPESSQDGNLTSEITISQSNALASAKSYLDFMPFSYQGLIKQLEFEQFSTEDATYAADHCGADWNEQALKSAKDYLNYTAFSFSGLIDQLEYEGFTTEQATYGAENCGADWNEQAAKSAQDYLDFSSFSRSGLIDQLIYEGFTQEQAEYGVSAVGY